MHDDWCPSTCQLSKQPGPLARGRHPSDNLEIGPLARAPTTSDTVHSNIWYQTPFDEMEAACDFSKSRHQCPAKAQPECPPQCPSPIPHREATLSTSAGKAMQKQRPVLGNANNRRAASEHHSAHMTCSRRACTWAQRWAEERLLLLQCSRRCRSCLAPGNPGKHRGNKAHIRNSCDSHWSSYTTHKKHTTKKPALRYTVRHRGYVRTRGANRGYVRTVGRASRRGPSDNLSQLLPFRHNPGMPMCLLQVRQPDNRSL